MDVLEERNGWPTCCSGVLIGTSLNKCVLFPAPGLSSASVTLQTEEQFSKIPTKNYETK